MISNETVDKLELVTVGDCVFIGIVTEEKGKYIISKRFKVSQKCTKEELKEYVLTEYEDKLPEPLKCSGQTTAIISCPLTRQQKFDLGSILRELEFTLETADRTLKASLLRK
jgi:hypothetical protein